MPPIRLANAVWNGRTRVTTQTATPYKQVGAHVTHKITVCGDLKNRYHKIYMMIYLKRKKTKKNTTTIEVTSYRGRDETSAWQIGSFHADSGTLLPLYVSVASDCSSYKHQHRSFSSHTHLCLPDTNMSCPSCWTLPFLLKDKDHVILKLTPLASSTIWIKQNASNKCMSNGKGVGKTYNCFLAVYLPTATLTQCWRKYIIILLSSIIARTLFKFTIRFSGANPTTS